MVFKHDVCFYIFFVFSIFLDFFYRIFGENFKYLAQKIAELFD